MYNTARKSLNDYLTQHLAYNTTNDCTLITGDWGTGKSHFINQYLDKLAKDQKTNRMIIYTSLFKAHSIDALQNDVLSKHQKWKKARQKLALLWGEIKSCIPYASYVPTNFVFSLLDEQDFKNSIIVFDDFERLSPNIELQNVLGYISDLKEVNKCKIIIITNERITTTDSPQPLYDSDNEQTPKNKVFHGKETWHSFKEKIVDNYFIFRPTSEENIDILLNTHKFKNLLSIKEKLCSLIEANKIINMRTIQKILNNIKHFPIILNNRHSKISRQSIEFIVSKTIEHNHKNVDRSKFYTRSATDEEAPDVNAMILEFIFSGYINLDLFNKLFSEYIKESRQDESIHETITNFYHNIGSHSKTATEMIVSIIKSNNEQLRYGTIIRLLVFFHRTDTDLFNKYSYLFTKIITSRLQEYYARQTLYSEIHETFHDIEHISFLNELAKDALATINAKEKESIIYNDEKIKKILSAKNRMNSDKTITKDIPKERWRDIIERRVIDLHDVAIILNDCSKATQDMIVSILRPLQGEPFLKTKLHACGLEQHLLEQFSEDTPNGKTR
ncbi:P-loop NTPase fold protein [Solidesulfovibrio carbinolicus]|uniref:P-loop NTPase fold protein n=1 Tax=Solidesulfovibrio carbinolicus TaxID=296842 RepID=UPI00101076EE|nr:P-loop NTPase fold protein [Solidesulfovibrio carbinolicus]